MNMDFQKEGSQLGLAIKDNDFLDNLRRKYEQEEIVQAPTNEELSAQKKQQENSDFAAFFGFTLDDVTEVEILNSTVQDAVEISVKKEEDIVSLTVEEATKRFENGGDGDVFERPGVQFIPHQNDNVVRKGNGNSYSSMEESKRLQRESQFGYLSDAEKNTRTTANPTYTSNQSNYNQNSSTNQRVNTGTSSSNLNARSAVNSFDDMNKSVRRVAAQRVNGWNRNPEVDEMVERSMKRAKWHKKLWYKTKQFFKGGKGRITIKVGIAMLLQFAMGIVGKRYQFENAGQMAMMFSLLLGSFFITRELAEEGIDPTGFSF